MAKQIDRLERSQSLIFTLPKHFLIVFLLLIPAFLTGTSFLLGSWKYTVLFLFFLVYSALVFFKIEWAIIILLIFSPIMRMPFVGYILEQIKFGMISLIFIVWLAKRLIIKNGTYEKVPASINLFFITLLFVLIVTTLHSVNIKISLSSSLLYLSSIMTFYIFYDILKKERLIGTIIKVIFLLGIFISTVAILQYCIVQFNLFTGLANLVLPAIERDMATVKMESEPFIHIYRSVGTFFHANELGCFTAILIPLGICLFYSSTKILEKIFYLFSLLALLLALFCSNSRGGMFSVACSTIFISIFYYRKTFKWLIPLTIVLLLVYIKYDDEINAYFRFTAGISYRNIIWYNIIDMIKVHPFLGWGIGTIPPELISRFGFASLGDLDIVLQTTIAEGGFLILESYTAHNAILNLMAEMGFIAPLLIIWFHFIFFRKAAMVYKAIGNGPLRGVIVGFMASIIGSLSNAVFESIIVFVHTPTNIILMFIFAGIFALDKRFTK